MKNMLAKLEALAALRVGVCGFSLLLLVACGAEAADESAPGAGSAAAGVGAAGGAATSSGQAAAGEAGNAAGTSSQGGAAGQAVGQAGTAGNGQAPSAGSSGSAAGAGAAGTTAGESGAAGSAGEASAAAGAAGTAGAGGAAGTPVDPNCGGGSDASFALVGFATQAGGTTGGRGGTTVNVSDGAALIAALQAQQDSSAPLTILVSGTITVGNSGGAEKVDVKDVSNVSILGTGDGAELDGIGIKIVRASNIVIRNLEIHHVASGDKDAISIEGPADHIWIDHCELYADYQEVDKDFYDGLLDVKGEAEYITYSWNYFHDSWKTALAGSSEEDTFDRKLTLHHNYFENCNSRLPLFRGGQGHVFNNYYEDIVETGINSRIGACLLIEGNHFVRAKNPYVSAYSDELGGGELACNLLDEGTAFSYADDIRELPSCDANIPYDYAAVLTHPEHVRTVVMANAGVGKLDDPTQF